MSSYLFQSYFKKNCYHEKGIKIFMHRQDAIYLDQFCPKISNKNWRDSLNKITNYKCIYCGKPSESLDHLHPMSKGGTSSTSNCVPCCLSCNGRNQIQKFLVGTENKIFMILEELWRYEHGLMKI